jgi:hypothetical protein
MNHSVNHSGFRAYSRHSQLRSFPAERNLKRFVFVHGLSFENNAHPVQPPIREKGKVPHETTYEHLSAKFPGRESL